MRATFCNHWGVLTTLHLEFCKFEPRTSTRRRLRTYTQLIKTSIPPRYARLAAIYKYLYPYTLTSQYRRTWSCASQHLKETRFRKTSGILGREYTLNVNGWIMYLPQVSAAIYQGHTIGGWRMCHVRTITITSGM